MLVLISFAMAQVTGGAPPSTSAQLFRPSIDGTHTLWADDTARADNGSLVARGVLQYVRNPLLWESGDGQVTRVVGDLFQLSMLAGYTAGPVRLGIDVPVLLRTIGDAGGESGIGDISLDVKASLVDRKQAPLGLALGGRASLPTASVLAPLGNRGFGWELQGIADREFGSALITANLGLRGVPREQLENFDWGTQLVARLGSGYALTADAGLSAELGATVGLTEVNAAASPVEGLLGGWIRSGDWVGRGGIGTGLTEGFGSPQLRTLLSVSYQPRPAPDTDADGLVDPLDRCPTQAEDLDGFEDLDGCPDPTQVTIAVVDPDGSPIPGARFTVQGTEPQAGNAGGSVPLASAVYPVDLSAEGYAPRESLRLVVPDGAMHTAVFTLEPLGAVARMSVVIVDPNANLLADALWSLDDEAPLSSGTSRTVEAGDHTVQATSEGYRPSLIEVSLVDGAQESLVIVLQPARVELTAERIDIHDSVYFETGQATIKSNSFAILDEVAQLLTDHTEITSVRIEGHTDSRGSAGSNLTLSRRRASAVRDYLIGKGVEGGRLESEGYGESRPVQAGDDEAAWSRNRRVDFFVAERGDD